MKNFDLEFPGEHDPLREPIQVADRLWWVGHVQPDDPFQCHVYLLEQGDQSVLFDPGSRITFRHTLSKIQQVVPFSKIKYFVCHHQDPDIASALPLIDAMVAREDAVVVTHWRAKALLRHYDLRLPFWLVDENDWQLQLPDRLLRFVFTPYAHFPGAFCSFDTATRALLSSDLFGGFTDGFALVARDESYFEALRPFHEHYIPSREVMSFALDQIERHPVRLILPQHGSIIPERLIPYILHRLRELECGLYLMAGEDSDIRRLSQLNQTLRDITHAMVVSRDFREIAARLLEIARPHLPVKSLEFFAGTDAGAVLHFGAGNRFRGSIAEDTRAVDGALGVERERWLAEEGAAYRVQPIPTRHGGSDPALLLPLFPPDGGIASGAAIIRLARPVSAHEGLNRIIEQMAVPLQVALEREVIYRSLDLERQRIYERSIRDPLTGLFTRLYMQDNVQRMLAIHDRDAATGVAVALLDIDHFKRINDNWGHLQGDAVLQQVGESILENIRPGDLAVRFGGEEFAVFAMGDSATKLCTLAERLRSRVESLVLKAPLSAHTVTLSIGVALRRQQESLASLLERADRALYEAKAAGRNRVRKAEDLAEASGECHEQPGEPLPEDTPRRAMGA